MNIIEIEQLPFSARTSRYKERDKKVTYMFVDEYYSQSIDKKISISGVRGMQGIII